MRASSLLIGLTALPVVALSAPNLGKPGTCLYLLSDTNQLACLTDSTPAQTSPPIAITNLTVGDSLVAIDVRPMNQQLYGLGVNTTNDTIQLYCISSVTGYATPVGPANGMTDNTGATIQLDATRYGIDFNPAVDRLRVVTSSGVSFRVNPTTGACIDGDGNAGNGINPDAPINGLTTTVGEVAYTNNVPDNGNITTLYTIDPVTDSIYIQNPPNNGSQTLGVGIKVGGIPLNFNAACGFDIPVGVNVTTSNTAATGFAYAVLDSGTRRLYRINLTTGDATQLSIPSGIAIRSLAVCTQVPLAIGLTATGNLVRFRRNNPTTTTTQALNLAALAANETLVGIDYRPATGQLYGLAINSTANSGSLYLIDPMTGVVSLAVGGTQGSIQFVDASVAVIPMPPATDGYGMDFNPAVDRLRVTSGNAGGAGINFRVNPNTGFPVDGNFGGALAVTGTNPDGPLNGSSTGATSCAYTNSYGQQLTGGTTTLYALDPATDSLYIMNPPNAGNLTVGKPLKLNGATLDFTAASGFDITQEGGTGTTSNAASPGDGWAALTVGGVTKLYRINLRTGETTLAGNIGAGTTVLVGLVAAGEAGSGHAPFTWDSAAGVACRIDTSTDCVNWQPFGTVTTTATTTTAPVPFYDGERRRFWRAVTP